MRPLWFLLRTDRRPDADRLVGLIALELDTDGLVTAITSVYDPRQSTQRASGPSSTRVLRDADRPTAGHLIPVVLGDGVRSSTASRASLPRGPEVIEDRGVTHLRYRVLASDVGDDATARQVTLRPAAAPAVPAALAARTIAWERSSPARAASAVRRPRGALGERAPRCRGCRTR